MRETLTRAAWYGLDNGKLAAIVVKKIDLIISVAQFLHGKDHENYSNYPYNLVYGFFLQFSAESDLTIKLTKVLLTGRRVRQRLLDQTFFVSSTREVTIDHFSSLGRVMTTAN